MKASRSTNFGYTRLWYIRPEHVAIDHFHKWWRRCYSFVFVLIRLPGLVLPSIFFRILPRVARLERLISMEKKRILNLIASMKAVYYYSAHFSRENERLLSGGNNWLLGSLCKIDDFVKVSGWFLNTKLAMHHGPPTRKKKENGGNIEYEFISDNVLEKM